VEVSVDFLFGGEGEAAVLCVQEGLERFDKGCVVYFAEPNRAVCIIYSVLSWKACPQTPQLLLEQISLSGV
jgi:hypothetical protein